MPKAAKIKTSSSRATASTKDPKLSHLYTDDNPKTTLHGTGFKDAATAHRTISLVSKRSLTYQFQTINTMLYRAKHHPHKTSAIEEAILILQEWVDGYKERKAALREFKLLTRHTIDRFLKISEAYNEDHEHKDKMIDTEFAQLYVALPPTKRLCNTLVDDEQPGEEDWDVRRYKALIALIPDEAKTITSSQLWLAAGRPTEWHLRMIMWGYSPSKQLK